MWAATNGSLTLIAEYDDDPMNPRADYGNFGTMTCWHRRYSLGDKHNHSDPEDFLRDMVRKLYAGKEHRILRMLRRRKLCHNHLKLDRDTGDWMLMSKDPWRKDGGWYDGERYSLETPDSKVAEWFYETIYENLSITDMRLLLNAVRGFMMLPLYLYDHGGITMSTGDFCDRWDSGQVGWVYATPDMICKEYGDLRQEHLDKAAALLEAEVQTYDLYLTGQCYGFRCYEGEDEADSCWGFLGEYDDFLRELPAHIGEAYQPLVAELAPQRTDSIAQYFWNLRHQAS